MTDMLMVLQRRAYAMAERLDNAAKDTRKPISDFLREEAWERRKDAEVIEQLLISHGGSSKPKRNWLERLIEKQTA